MGKAIGHFVMAGQYHQNPNTHICTDASSYGWGASCNSETCGGHFSTTEKELHKNILELKAALFGMKSFYKEATNQHILIHIDYTSAIVAINKMGSMVSVEMDVVVHEIWDREQSTKNWITATHIPGIFNIEADKESRVKKKELSRWPVKLFLISSINLNLSPILTYLHPG